MKDFFERYANRIAIPEDKSACWIWIGASHEDGYGCLRRGRKNIRATRAAFECIHGDGSAANLVIRHTCDCPPCVNPNHLRGGSYKDAVTRGRIAYGPRHGNAKLSENDIQQMLALAHGGMLGNEIAARFGVAATTVSGIIRGKHWRRLTENKAAPKPSRRGERGGHVLLTEAKVREIKRLLNQKIRHADIAVQYQVSKSAIHAISRSQTWGHIK